MSNKQQEPPTFGARGSLRRYVLTGAALGLYFGLFFRPVRQPSLLFVVQLSLAAALLMTMLQLRHREKRSIGKLLPYFLRAWAGFALLLAMLEGRHFFYDLGGRPIVTLFTLLYGAGLGLFYAARDKEMT
ncbi:MAG TPA: hypothetical protein VK879_09025 [Candidatus Sulfomarinibacteraceae bacterium]|nr:hypothetical protein [Candidatus Sulfomarinibacteraceae bacterium]